MDNHATKTRTFRKISFKKFKSTVLSRYLLSLILFFFFRTWLKSTNKNLKRPWRDIRMIKIIWKKKHPLSEIVEFSQKRGRRTIARTSDTSLRLSVQFRSCGWLWESTSSLGILIGRRRRNRMKTGTIVGRYFLYAKKRIYSIENTKETDFYLSRE